MTLASEAKNLSTEAQAELKAIVTDAGRVISATGRIETNALAWLRAHWIDLAIAFAIGVVVGVLS